MAKFSQPTIPGNGNGDRSIAVIEHFGDASKAITQESRKKVWMAANLVRTNLVSSVLVGGRSGRIYKIPGTKRTYTASAPGQAPASRLGDLRRSYSVLPKSPSQVKSKAAVGSPLDYALSLEKGTRKMAPRVHLRTAFTNVKNDITKMLTEHWKI